MLDPLDDRSAPGSLLGLAGAFADPLGLLPDWINDPSRVTISAPGRVLSSPLAAGADAPKGDAQDGASAVHGVNLDGTLRPALAGPTEAPDVVRLFDVESDDLLWLPPDEPQVFLPALEGEKPASSASADLGTSSMAAPVAPVASSGLVSLAGSEASFVSAGGPMTFNEYAPELPPNKAPVATDDTATVSEDDSVIIDVLANDSDADGDTLHIDTWNWQPTNGTVTQTEDGKLKYVPFPDFHGIDTFTYAVSDGRDVSNTATVTVTVSSVNDAPFAFNDVFTFIRPGVHKVPPMGSGAVLLNDADLFDGLGVVGIAELDTTGTIGTVDMDPWTGEFDWEGPLGYAGQTTFKYKALDDNGAASDWATVMLWAILDDPPVSPPPVLAEPDLEPVGELPRTFNVLDNDDYGGDVAVLEAPPGSRGVIGFDFDGTVHYAPWGGMAVGGELTYRLYSPDGRVSATTTAQMAKVDLEISHGQNGNAVRESPNDDETKVGAFTVVNRNDTDGSGKRDHEQAGGVLGANGTGVNEEDLMRLRVHKPAGFGGNPNDTLTVTVTNGAAKLWQLSTREGDLGKNLTLGVNDFKVGGNPVNSLDVWVEIYEPTNVKRDIEIQMKWGNATPDTVKATGVWAELTGFHITGTTYGNDADDNWYRRAFETLTFRFNSKGVGEPTAGFKLGNPEMFWTHAVPLGAGGIPTHYHTYLVNIVEFEFKALPTGIETENAWVRFDLARTIQSKHWRREVGQAIGDPTTVRILPDYRDRANDDGIYTDEDNTPTTNDRMYQFDAPGHKLLQSAAAHQNEKYNESIQSDGKIKTYDRVVSRLNGLEFVRVKVDGGTFEHNLEVSESASTPEGANAISPQGSRASELIDWHSWTDFTWDAPNSKWVRTPDVAGQAAKRNDIDRGFVDLAQPAL